MYKAFDALKSSQIMPPASEQGACIRFSSLSPGKRREFLFSEWFFMLGSLGNWASIWTNTCELPSLFPFTLKSVIYIIKELWASVSLYKVSASVGCWMALWEASLMQRKVRVNGVPRQHGTEQVAALWVKENSAPKCWPCKMLKCFVWIVISKYATIYEY